MFGRTIWLLLLTIAAVVTSGAAPKNAPTASKRWLFIWRDLTDPKEVDRAIARFPAARAAGYNGVVCSFDVAASKATEFAASAKKNGLEIICIVMGSGHDRNDIEGVLAQDVPYVAHGNTATVQPDSIAQPLNGDFESATVNKFSGWTWQDDIGVTTFADTTIKHGGRSSLRMENIAKNPNGLCRVSQPIKLNPHRQYHISAWIKTENLRPAIPEIKVLTDSPQGCISWQTFPTAATQDWRQIDLVFNSFDETAGRIYLGFWGGKEGKIWWDDLRVEEIGLVNVLRRPGCPVTVRGEGGTVYSECQDYERIADPQFHPWIAWRGSSVAIKLTPTSRILEQEKLRVSYYHPIVVYEDRLNYCLSEPRVFDDWRADVKLANERLHPAGFLMSHDEIRCANQCALCRSKNLSAGALLAENVRKAAAIIREIRPDASIWVWNDMFDPQHNAVDHYYAVRGSLANSWQGLDKDVGIVNWHGGLKGANCKFFADMGLKQILSGYYDSDEDGSQIAEWRQNVKSIPGIVGAMYTTWEDKYEAMAPWAKKAWPP